MTRKHSRSEFSARTKQQAFDRENGLCQGCGAQILPANPAEFDHDIPCSEGGDNSLENCVVLGSKCCATHKEKSAGETARCAKADRLHRKHIGIEKKKRKMPYRTADGTIHWNGKQT